MHTVNPGFVETPGFPQRTRFGFLMRRIVVDPSFVAERILDAIEHDKREIFVPRWYRPAAWLQALFPGTLTPGGSRVKVRWWGRTRRYRHVVLKAAVPKIFSGIDNAVHVPVTAVTRPRGGLASGRSRSAWRARS